LKIHIKKIHPDLPLPSVEAMRDMMNTAYGAPALYSALTTPAEGAGTIGQFNLS